MHAFYSFITQYYKTPPSIISSTFVFTCLVLKNVRQPDTYVAAMCDMIQYVRYHTVACICGCVISYRTHATCDSRLIALLLCTLLSVHKNAFRTPTKNKNKNKNKSVRLSKEKEQTIKSKTAPPPFLLQKQPPYRTPPAGPRPAPKASQTCSRSSSTWPARAQSLAARSNSTQVFPNAISSVT